MNLGDFNVHDRVQICNFPKSDQLYGATGTILGVSTNLGEGLGFKTYIVGLDNPLPHASAVTITNACLKRI